MRGSWAGEMAVLGGATGGFVLLVCGLATHSPLATVLGLVAMGAAHVGDAVVRGGW